MSTALLASSRSHVDPIVRRLLTPPDATSGVQVPYGAALNLAEARAGTDIGKLAERYCDAVVTAGPLFMRYLRPSQSAFDFSQIDTFLAFTEGAGLPVRGSTLIWHAMLPGWLETAPGAANLEELRLHVGSVVARLKGRIAAWDVVNEVLRPSDGLPFGLRNTLWFRGAGPRYVAEAFRAARAADPSAILGYNEYGTEDDGREADEKRTSVLRFCELLVKNEVPIDYFGMQAHLSSGQTFSRKKLGAFLRDLHGFGLRVLVTELDAEDNSWVATAKSRTRVATDLYRRFLDAAMEAPYVSAVYTWGITDRYYWQRRPLHLGEAKQHPLPFDETLQPKEIWAVLKSHNIGIKGASVDS